MKHRFWLATFILLFSVAACGLPSSAPATQTHSQLPSTPAFAPSRPSTSPSIQADIIFTNGDILTMDASNPTAQAIAIQGGKVEYCAAGFEALCPSASSSDLGPASVTVTASSSLPDSPPGNALDGNIETLWSSGSSAPQWIQIDLGKATVVSAIRLVISQYPEGNTIHQIWVGADANNLTLVHEFKGFTKDPDTLEFIPSVPLTNIRYVKIVTTQSPSWVAWREIEVNGQ